MSLEFIVRNLILLRNLALTVAYVSALFHYPVGPSNDFMQVHLSVAGVAVLLSLFTDTCVIFYFVGTGVWIKDRSKEFVAQERDRALRIWDVFQRANKLKGKSMPFATLGIVLGLFTFILGGANQVGAIPRWVHPTLATFLVAISWFATRFYSPAIRDNLNYLNQVSAEIVESATASS